MRWVLIAGCIAALPAFASEPAKPENLPVKNLALAFQQVEVATEIYIADAARQLAVKDARIAEWEAYFAAYVGAQPQPPDKR